MTGRTRRRPDERRRDGRPDRRREEAEPAREVRLSVADELLNAVRKVLQEGEGGLPSFLRRKADVETLLEYEILEEQAEEARVDPSVVDGGEGDEDEDGVEDGQADGGDNVAEEGEKAWNEGGKGGSMSDEWSVPCRGKGERRLYSIDEDCSRSRTAGNPRSLAARRWGVSEGKKEEGRRWTHREDP